MGRILNTAFPPDVTQGLSCHCFPVLWLQACKQVCTGTPTAMHTAMHTGVHTAMHTAVHRHSQSTLFHFILIYFWSLWHPPSDLKPIPILFFYFKFFHKHMENYHQEFTFLKLFFWLCQINRWKLWLFPTIKHARSKTKEKWLIFLVIRLTFYKAHLLFIMCVFLCMCMCMKVPKEPRRGNHIP